LNNRKNTWRSWLNKPRYKVRGASDASHYKEYTKLQAEVASLNCGVEQLELDKQELEHNVEELTLNNEQIQEEKESLEDRCEDLKLDREMAQMEVDKLRIELEDVKAAQEGAALLPSTSAVTTTAASDHSSNKAPDLAQSLNVKEAHLRKP
jgi:chromosome segregation ATPase